MPCEPFNELMKHRATDMDFMKFPEVAPSIYRSFQEAMKNYRFKRSDPDKITYDDVLNLRIFIESDCCGVTEFIERM